MGDGRKEGALCAKTSFQIGKKTFFCNQANDTLLLEESADFNRGEWGFQRATNSVGHTSTEYFSGLDRNS